MKKEEKIKNDSEEPFQQNNKKKISKKEKTDVLQIQIVA